ncbi:MAG: 2,3-bisphosphoglycerate-independent phosphoglycerate mutase [Patescibacteria group bacterium]
MFNFFSLFKKNYNFKNVGINPVVLLVLDGWGLAPASAGNPIPMAKTPNMNSLMGQYPHTELIASGESVGLPANEVGNTEVGHLNLGAGRTIYQDLKRINIAIENGRFFDNEAFVNAVKHVKQNASNLHIIGLVSSGNVHSSLSHFFALHKFCQKYAIKNLYLHLFTDGRDAPPKEALDIVGKIEGELKTSGFGTIASVSGRYYAMDRDRRWDRTKLAYEAIVSGLGPTASSALDAIKGSYDNGKTDEFVVPTVITKDGKPVATLNDNDAAIFFNFRIDRPRQLTMAITASDFKQIASSWEFDPYAVKYDFKEGRDEKKLVLADPFDRQKIVKNLFFVTMTEYQKSLTVSAIAFPPEIVDQSLPQILSDKGVKQMHMSESEKERFVTYYFNGLREGLLPNEEKLIVPSPKVATYDKNPQMSVFALVEKFKETISKNIYKFFIVNFANPDMVAHTGNLAATIAALQATDMAVGEVVKAVLGVGGTLLITADHGNAEELLTFENTSYFFTSAKGTINTDHSNNPVPLIIVAKDLQGKNIGLPKGTLADIAPTILNLMGIAIPEKMTGRDLLQALKI